MKKLLVLFSFCLAAGTVLAGLTKTRDQKVALSEEREVVFAVPEGFSFNAETSPNGVVAVKLAAEKNVVTLDLEFLPDPEGKFGNARARREQMYELFANIVDSSTEKAMQFEELEPRTGAGTYCIFTDASLVGKTELPPNEYLHMTVGVKAWPGVLAVFRCFSNETTSAAYKAAFDMLRTSVDEKPVPFK